MDFIKYSYSNCGPGKKKAAEYGGFAAD